MTRALIIGSAGQDGSLLAERLAGEGAAVFCIDRLGTNNNVSILDRPSVEQAVSEFKPTEVYYLAAAHHSSQQITGDTHDLVQRSFGVHVTGLLHVLDALTKHAPKARLFYAASSHVFGTPSEAVQTEETPFAPICPYGITKTAGAQLCRYYREQHNIAASVGILYNHESPRRLPHYVSQKIVRAAIAIRDGKQKSLELGNLDAAVDWGYAPDYVDAMVLITRDAQAGEYIIATGKKHTVGEFARHAFKAVALDADRYVTQDPSLLHKPGRTLVGNAGKLHRETGWCPSVTFEEMVARLISAAENET